MRTSYKYRLLIILYGFFLVFGSSNGIASAHVLQENNGVAAVLHIPPDDNPVAGQTTALDFAFSSEQGNFSLTDCDCQVKVRRDGKVIQTTALHRPVSGSVLDAAATVSFPTIDVYNVIVSGNSKSAKFPPFKLTYIERVATSAHAIGPAPSSNESTVIFISVASFLILTMVAYAAIKSGHRYTKPTKKV